MPIDGRAAARRHGGEFRLRRDTFPLARSPRRGGSG
jgi:hypothetical protein